jgi:hypothetical protein
MIVRISFMVSVGLLMTSQAYSDRLMCAGTLVPDMEFCDFLYAV